MKILWIVNIIFPFPAKKLGLNETNFGGWLQGLADTIREKENVKLAIATVYSGKKILEFSNENIIYYLIPGAPALEYKKDLEKYWKIINDKFKPDLVHIHGTEYAHGLAFKNANPHVKVITSIQGLVSRCAEVYTANIGTKEILKSITLRDILKKDNIFQQKSKFIKRGLNEIELIQKSEVILGRTMWDYANTKAINRNNKYYTSNETLRESFYKEQWNINQTEAHSIFCSQAGYPIKGAHYLIKAISILKYQYGYNDIKLYIAGPNIADNSNINKKIRMTGYANYIRKLIHKLGLEKQILWTGILNEKEMVSRLLKTRIFVLPSALENSSNSLCEAMLLGMPCVATNTGGTMDILEHKKEGYLYPYTEPAICAEYILKFFEDDELSIKMGKEAREKALERHNPEKNAEDIIEIYKKVIGEL